MRLAQSTCEILSQNNNNETPENNKIKIKYPYVFYWPPDFGTENVNYISLWCLRLNPEPGMLGYQPLSLALQNSKNYNSLKIWDLDYFKITVPDLAILKQASEKE